MRRWVLIASGLGVAVACGGEEDAGGSASGGAAGAAASGGTASGGSAGSGSGGAPSGGGAAGSPSGGGAGVAGGTDAGSGGSGGLTADAGTDGGGGVLTLFEQKGAVFVPSAGEPMKKLSFGVKGTVYGWVRVELDVTVGAYQPEVPDPGNPDRTEHIFFGLFRANQSQSDQRYLMGTAAVTFATKAPHFRMFGRKTLGPGYTTYTSWSKTYSWQKADYHLDCLLDGVLDVQRCKLSLGGSVVETLEGTVAYLDPVAHLSSGFYLELGTAKPADIEASPLGWTFSNLSVTAGLGP
jgi:hypothetical protein